MLSESSALIENLVQLNVSLHTTISIYLEASRWSSVIWALADSIKFASCIGRSRPVAARCAKVARRFLPVEASLLGMDEP